MRNKHEGNWSDTYGFINEEEVKIKLAKSISKNNESKPNSISEQKSGKLQIKISTNRSAYVIEEKSLNPPFVGTKLLENKDIMIEDLLFYLDKKALFSGQWQLKRNKNQSPEEYNYYLETYAEPLLNKWMSIIIENKLVSPKAVYGYFNCGRFKNSISIFDDKKTDVIACFDFPRQKSGHKLCIADFFSDMKNSMPSDFIPMQAVTMGDIASEYSQKLFKSDKYSDYLIFHGLTVQLAEALAEYIHSKIRIECGFKSEEPDATSEILAQKYRGARYSFGYPACPKVSDSNIQLSLLDAKRIKLTMDESEQLHPEQSTTAIISLHSKAKYFSA